MKNAKIVNAIERFTCLPKKGRFEKYEELPYITSIVEHHVQGYSKGTINGKRYAGFTHSDDDGGKIIFVRENDGEVRYINLPDYPHPSGIQFFDNYVFVSTSHDGAKVFVYDVEKVFSGSAEKEIKTFNFSGHGGTTMGISDFEYDGKSYVMLAIISSSNTCNIYISNNAETIGDLNFTKYNSFTFSTVKCTVDSKEVDITDFSTQCVGLLTDETNKVHLLVTRSTSCEKEDYAYIFPLSITKEDNRFNVTLDSSNILGREFENNGGVVGSSGTHFRWGAGVEVTPSGQFNIVATSRNIIAGTFLNTTIWDILEELTGDVGRIKLTNMGAFVAELDFIYRDPNSKEETRVKGSGKDILVGKCETVSPGEYGVPEGAEFCVHVDVALGKDNTSTKWHTFSATSDIVANYTIDGTTLNNTLTYDGYTT